MILRFNMQRHDNLAFSRAYYASSPTYRSARTRVRLTLPLLMLIVWGYTTIKTEFDWVRTSIYAAVTLLWYFLYPLRYDRSVEKYTEKFIDENSGSKNFGPYELELSEKGIHAFGPSGTSTFHWDLVDRVSLTDTYLFIFLSGPMGYPIPIKDIGNELAVQAQRFIEQNKAQTFNKQH